MITAKEKLAEIERELKYRAFVYQRRIDDGKMTRETADKQIAIMRAIRDDYRNIVNQEKQPVLL